MRLLHVISSVDPRYGGTVESIKQLAAAHARLGHVTEVASVDDPRTPALAGHGLHLHALGPRLTHYSYAPRLVPWLTAHADAYDAVIVNGLWQYPGYAVWRALRNRDTPYFVFPHGMLDPWFKRTYPLKHVKKWLFWPWADYRVLRDARAVLFTCEEERRLARESFWLYRCNEAVVTLGTAVSTGDEASERALFLERHPDLANKRILLFLSRLHEKKGCDLLIDAFAAVAGRDPALQLVMAGPDQTGWRSVLETRARERGIAQRITWTGMLEDGVKWGAYRCAEAFVLPSHQENFGIVVAEALACGVPVLISHQVNIWREVAADEAGLVEPDTATGTRALLERWLALSPAAQTAMREAARRCYAQRFDSERAARRIEQVLIAGGAGMATTARAA